MLLLSIPIFISRKYWVITIGGASAPVFKLEITSLHLRLLLEVVHVVTLILLLLVHAWPTHIAAMHHTLRMLLSHHGLRTTTMVLIGHIGCSALVAAWSSRMARAMVLQVWVNTISLTVPLRCRCLVKLLLCLIVA